jgi:uncharacterized protein (TIGR00730 family)
VDLGRLIAERGYRLVYGAGGIGLMGALGASMERSGGHITGVVPYFLRHREASDQLPQQELVLTRDLFERKRRMCQFADAYVALPGGYGTLDEVLEVISATALGLQEEKPLILVNVARAWDPFVYLVGQLLADGFVRGGEGDLFSVVDTPEEAIALVDRLRLSAPIQTGAVPAQVALTEFEEVS